MKDKLKAWWGGLSESTKRAIKTLWQAFAGTFLVTFATGLTTGLVGKDALVALCVSALSAAVAAVAAKLVNIGGDIVDDAEKVGGSDE